MYAQTPRGHRLASRSRRWKRKWLALTPEEYARGAELRALLVAMLRRADRLGAAPDAEDLLADFALTTDVGA